MSWWDRNIVEPGKLPLLCLLIAFVVTFLTTRTITRMIRSGRGPFKNNITSSGLHIHHSVPGIILLLIGSTTSVAVSPHAPWREIAAVLIGVGSSLVLDEFAMILHLQDVYWSQEGEASVQAVAFTAMSLGALLVGLSPFGVNDVHNTEAGVRIAGLLAVVVTILAVIVCARKGKFRLGMLAIFLPIVAFVGAVRLARPDSRWAKRHYDAAKTAHAERRAAAFDKRWDPTWRRLGDLVAGTPSAPAPAAATAASSPATKHQ